MTQVISLRRRHHDLHDMRRFEFNADAGPHRWIFGVDPFVPGAVHLAFALHVGDVDDGRQNPALVRAAQRKTLVDPPECLDGLLVQRGGDRIGRDRYREYQVVVNDGAAAGRREACKGADHWVAPFRSRLANGRVPRHPMARDRYLANERDGTRCKAKGWTLSLARE